MPKYSNIWAYGFHSYSNHYKTCSIFGGFIRTYPHHKLYHICRSIIHACIYTYMHAGILHTCVCVCMPAYTHALTHSCIHTWLDMLLCWFYRDRRTVANCICVNTQNASCQCSVSEIAFIRSTLNLLIGILSFFVLETRKHEIYNSQILVIIKKF